MKLTAFDRRLSDRAALLPATLNRRQTYILPTRHGMLFLLVLLGMLIGSVNYNNNLGFLLVFLLGGMALVSMIHTYRNLIGLEILSVSARPVFAGETAAFRFLVNAGAVERKGLVFTIEKGRKTIEDIETGADVPIHAQAQTRRRGLFRAGPLTIWSRFPMGLFYAWSTIPLNLSCIVYPKPEPGPFQVLWGAIPAGDAMGEANEAGADDFMGLKPYQPGDPIRHISWKTLSRGQGLFTKDFAGHGRTSVMFDYAAINAADPESKISRLCDLVLKASGMHLEYGLTMPGGTISPGWGDQHKHICLRTLALFGHGGQSS